MNFSLYSSQYEENIYIRKQAQIWRRSELITAEQLSAINGHTDHQLRQTNKFFQLLFFIFTWLGAGAVMGLFIWFLDFRNTNLMAVLWILFGTAFYAGAEYLVSKYKFYRYGIEEALVIIAIALFCAGCFLLLSENHVAPMQLKIIAPALVAATAYWIYLRFGFLYAAIISIIALGIIPFQFNFSHVVERLILLSVLSSIFILILLVDKADIEDFRKDRYSKIEAFLLIDIYLTVNLQILSLAGMLTKDAHIAHLNPQFFPALIYWSSYIFTFLIPTAALYWGIRSRKCIILNVSLALACITLATNKSYLGWTRYAWDPAILGVVLVSLSLFITRWLNSGEDQKRFGFTACNILKPEEGSINLADVAAALTPGIINAQQPQVNQQDKLFEGGTSGGGGVEGKF
ncbi:MAG: hypothetical protein ABFD50_12520 [Smithella sp.]